MGYIADATYGYNSVTNCAALNPSVKAASNVGRVVGSGKGTNTLSNNIAFSGLTNNSGTTAWNNKGANEIDGADITISAIVSDGTLGTRFTTANGWTTQTGKLPGLFGAAVNLPAHLSSGVSITNAQSPNITTHPAGATLARGASHTLTVAASSPDGGTLSYQWYSNTTAGNTGGVAISGATAASYAAPTGTAGTFHYYVVVTNKIFDNGDGGHKTATRASNAATLSISVSSAQIPTGITYLTDATVPRGAPGATHAFYVTANSPDGGALSYQWYSSATANSSGGMAISGAIGTTYYAPIDVAGTFYYYVVVTNRLPDNGDGGYKTATATSNVAMLRVTLVNAQLPAITTQPTGGTATRSAGSTYNLSIAASVTDGGTVSCQWYSNTVPSNTGGTPIYGATNASMAVPIDETGTFYYYAIITNQITDNGDGGQKMASVASNVAAITVSTVDSGHQLVITRQPAGLMTPRGAFGATYNLTVAASVSGGGALSYQWYRSTIPSNYGGTPIQGATAASYAAPIDQTGTYYYYVTVTGTVYNSGWPETVSATSAVATLTVNASAQAPYITMQPVSAALASGAAGTTYGLGVAVKVMDGEGNLSYQWYRNTVNSNIGGTPVLGAMNPTFDAPIDKAGTFYYYVVITNTVVDYGTGGLAQLTARSEVATLSITANAQTPIITRQPTSAEVQGGAERTTHNLIVTATTADDGLLNYQWHTNTIASNLGGTPINGATSAIYSASTYTPGIYYYYVVITNTIPNNGDGGLKTATVRSNPVTLTVHGIGVQTHNRTIPGDNARTNAEAAIIKPAETLTSEITAGPNPAGWGEVVNFYRRGAKIKDGKLVVYNASGNAVKKININDKTITGSNEKRLVASWNLTDSKSRPVGAGTYLVLGTVTTASGKKELILMPVGVR